MSALSSDVWSRLTNVRPHGETLWARRAVPEITDRLLAALDADGRRHLLVALDENDVHLNDTHTRGIRVATRELVIPEHASGWYIDVVCQDPSGHDAFQIVGMELAERLAKSTESAADSVARVLSKWRRFWGQLPRDLLSRDQQIGLFAELWFLNFWLFPRVSTATAIERWRGPVGGRHDFELSLLSVEAKGTTSTRGPVHRINGIDQLVAPEGGTLLLFSLRLREEAGAGNSLPVLAESCRQQIQADDEALSQFESRLSRAGYSPAHGEEYGKTRLRVLAEGLYVVRDDFPRIAPESFPTGVPAGVECIEYEVNLSGFERYRIPQSEWENMTL